MPSTVDRAKQLAQQLLEFHSELIHNYPELGSCATTLNIAARELDRIPSYIETIEERHNSDSDWTLEVCGVETDF